MLKFLKPTTVIGLWETYVTPELYLGKTGPFKQSCRSTHSLLKFAELKRELDAAIKSLKEKEEF